MRGEILDFDSVSGSGLITGDDGLRYDFDRLDVRRPDDLAPGLRVDFVAQDDRATQIVVLPAEAVPTVSLAAAAAAAPTDGRIDWGHLLFSFNGRTRRSHFWLAWAILLGVSILIGWIPVLGLITLLFIWPNTAIMVKRLHDMGLTGWFVLIPWVGNIVAFIVIFVSIGATALANPYGLENEDPAAVMALVGSMTGGLAIAFVVNLAFLLWVGITDSRPGPNVHGPNPKGL